MRRIHWLAIGVALTALLSAAALAPAKGIKISERSEDFTVDPLGEDEADCGGKRAVSGGFFGEFDLVTSAVIPLISTREGGSEWGFRAGDLGGGPSDATAYAYCAKKRKFPKLREGSEDDTTASGITRVTAECPGNRRVVSGGFEFPDTEVFVGTSMRRGRGSWTVEVFTGATAPVEVFAYCAKGVKLKQRSSETTLPTEDPDTEEARCKRKERVVSGGFDTESDGVTTAAVSSASQRSGKRSWEVTATAFGAPQPLTVYAYCLKEPKNK
jgi:hypothetical protein